MIYFDGKLIAYEKFPDQTSALKMPCLLNQRHKIVWLYDNDGEMVTIFYITQHLKELGESASLFMPYIPNARMDRVDKNKHPDDIFTLKYFANFINSLNFTNVTVLDPHSNVSQALFDRISTIEVSSFIKCIVEDCIPTATENLAFCYPDDGAMKRYSIENANSCYGVKHRIWGSKEAPTVALVGGEVVKDKDVLIIDDICSKGYTFFNMAKELKKAGAKNIYLYITHCENNIFNGELLDGDLITKIYTTGSIYRGNHEKIEVVAKLI